MHVKHVSEEFTEIVYRKISEFVREKTKDTYIYI
jgi:hypothetical protein